MMPVGSVETIISRLRPRSMGEMLDGAFRLYRRHFLTFLLIVAVVYVPVLLLSYLADVWLGIYQPLDLSGSISGNTSSQLAARNFASQASTIKNYLETFFTYFGQWALMVAVANAILDKPVTFAGAYRELGRRLGAAFGLVGLQALILLGFFSPVILLALLALFGGSSTAASAATSLLCILSVVSIAYFIIQVRLFVILPAAVNEDLRPREALRRSWELTRGSWWRTLGLSLLISVIKLVVELGPAALLVLIPAVTLKLDFYTDLALTRGIGILTTIIFVPVEIGAIALYYYDLRVRKEGFDLATAIAQRYEVGNVPENGQYGQYGQYGAEGSVTPPALGEGNGQGYVAGEPARQHAPELPGYGYGYGPGAPTQPVSGGVPTGVLPATEERIEAPAPEQSEQPTLELGHETAPTPDWLVRPAQEGDGKGQEDAGS